MRCGVTRGGRRPQLPWKCVRRWGECGAHYRRWQLHRGAQYEEVQCWCGFSDGDFFLHGCCDTGTSGRGAEGGRVEEGTVPEVWGAFSGTVGN